MNLLLQQHNEHLQPVSSNIFKMKRLQTDANTAVKKRFNEAFSISKSFMTACNWLKGMFWLQYKLSSPQTISTCNSV